MMGIHGGDWAGYKTEYGSLPLDYSANVSPLGLPDGVREAAVQALQEADRYPDPLCRMLRARLAQRHGVPAERIVCGNGAADLIFRICRVLRPKKAVLTAPDFGEYEQALREENCEIRSVIRKESEDFLLHWEALAESIRGTELLFLSNPNNPTGLVAERGELRKILKLCRAEHCVPVIDECFLDFTEASEAKSLIPDLGQNPELVILRAFTKTYAMAGLRLGYALCGSEAFAERLQSAGQPWPVSNVAQAAGIAALQEESYVNRMRILISAERPRMIRELTALGLRVISGEANYLLFCCEDGTLAEKLRKRGILIRDCRNYDGLSEGWYRIAIRTEAENKRLLQALREVR